MSSVRSRVQNFRSAASASASPSSSSQKLLKSTQRRRSRSRSRSRLLISDSEFWRAATDIKMISDTMEYIINTYSNIKDSSPVLKQSLQRSEEVALWVRQKAGDAVAAANMEEPLKRIDAAAAKGLQKMDETRAQMRLRWELANKQWHSRVRSFFLDLRGASDAARNAVLESVQTTLDYVENTFEPVMLPPSPEAAKYSEDVAPLLAMRRLIDITFRLHMGIAKYSLDGAKTILAPANLEKYTRPSKVRARLAIVAQELHHAANDPSSSASSSHLGFVDNKELTELDRGVIVAGRFAIGTAKDTVEAAKRRNAALGAGVKDTVNYAVSLFNQIGEAKSVRDVAGIGVRETRLAVEGATERLPALKGWKLVEASLQWLRDQEKKLE